MLIAEELPRAILNLPVAFVPNADGTFALAAIQGLRQKENLLVAADGRWLLDYVPANYRGYPFLLAKNNEVENEKVLCINEEYESFVNETEGDSFFTADGELSESLAKILNFLTKVSENREITRAKCEHLQRLELIQEWPIAIDTENGSGQVKGLFRIDEEKLNALDAEQLIAIRDSGALLMAYCQLISMQNLARIKNLLAEKTKTSLHLPDELNLDIGSDSGNISFDGF